MDVGRSDCMAVMCGWEVTVYMPEEVIWTSKDLSECLSGCMNKRLKARRYT